MSDLAAGYEELDRLYIAITGMSFADAKGEGSAQDYIRLVNAVVDVGRLAARQVEAFTVAARDDITSQEHRAGWAMLGAKAAAVLAAAGTGQPGAVDALQKAIDGLLDSRRQIEG